jgi:hypothetical protein
VSRRSNDNSYAVATTACFNVGDNVMRTFTMIVLLTVLVLGSQPAIAADCAGGTTTCSDRCCDRCGRHAACVEKACQVVCEMKKETKTCWQVECKEMCPLMPGCHHGCCGSCECKCPPPPRCGNPKCVKKLVKKEYQVEVPVYRCVVCHLCPDCCNGGSTDSPAVAPNPPSKPAAPALPPPPSVPLPSSKARQ